MDEADITSRRHERIEQLTIDNARSSFKQEYDSDDIYCVDCGVEIPLARRKAMPGCKRCVECQIKLEGANRWR